MIMRGRRDNRNWTLAIVAVLGLSAVAARAQEPDFSGWFRLNKGASQAVTGVGLSGLGQGGAPHTLFIADAANGTVTIGSDTNESHSRLYRTNGDSVLPADRGGEPIPITSRREGRTLVAEGAGLKETLAISADGKTLTISVTRSSTPGPATTTLVYERMRSVEPCTAWPTPCRRK